MQEIIPTTKIENLLLSARCVKILKAAGIQTAADFYDLTEYELSQIPGLAPQDIPMLMDARIYCSYQVTFSIDELLAKEKPYHPWPSLDTLDIREGTRKILHENGIHTMADLLSYSEKDLLSLHGIGPAGLYDIQFALDNTDCCLSQADCLPHPVLEKKPVITPKEKYDPSGILVPYSEPLLPGIAPSPDRFYIIVREEYKIKSLGVFPGSIAVFDRALPYQAGTMSCFRNTDGKVCFCGHNREEGLTHVGRVIAVLNYYPEPEGARI